MMAALLFGSRLLNQSLSRHVEPVKLWQLGIHIMSAWDTSIRPGRDSYKGFPLVLA